MRLWPLRTLGLVGAVALLGRPDCTPRDLLDLARALAPLGPGRGGVRPVAQVGEAALLRAAEGVPGARWAAVSDVAGFVLSLGGGLDHRLPVWACDAVRAWVAGGWRDGGDAAPRHPWIIAEGARVRAVAQDRARHTAAPDEAKRRGGR